MELLKLWNDYKSNLHLRKLKILVHKVVVYNSNLSSYVLAAVENYNSLFIYEF